MKNTIKMFEAIRSIAIIAFVAIIGFSFASCDGGGPPSILPGPGTDQNGPSETNGPGETLPPVHTVGRVTFTGLDDFNGYRFFVTGGSAGEDIGIMGGASMTHTGILTGAVVENGTVVLHLWRTHPTIGSLSFTGPGNVNHIAILDGRATWTWAELEALDAYRAAGNMPSWYVYSTRTDRLVDFANSVVAAPIPWQ